MAQDNTIKNKELKVALVCDWLTGLGGAERVVLELHKMFPNAPIYTSQYDPKKIDWFKGADIHTLWLQYLPKRLKKFLPILRAIAFRRLDLSNYDLVISSSGAEAKAIKTNKKAIHISYCHAPTHYYWMRYEEYLKNPGFGKLDWLARVSLRLLVGPLRYLDYKAAQKPNYLITNSNFNKKQIMKYYGRDSEVIYPPVDIDKFGVSGNTKRSGYVVLGRQTPYKRIDLAVKAATKLGLPLTVVGNGPDHRKLVTIAGSSIRFVTDANDKEVAMIVASSEGSIFPGLDDFGISAVEALGVGTPVIAYKAGGALDYIIENVNGLFFEKQTVDSLSKELLKFKPQNYNSLNISKSVEQFSVTKFRDKTSKFILKVL